MQNKLPFTVHGADLITDHIKNAFPNEKNPIWVFWDGHTVFNAKNIEDAKVKAKKHLKEMNASYDCGSLSDYYYQTPERRFKFPTLPLFNAEEIKQERKNK